MHCLKLAPFFVSIALNHLALVSAAPAPMDQSLPVGSDTVGLVTPAAIPDVKMPGAATGSGGIPINGVNSGKSATPAGVPAAPNVPGVPGTPSVPGLSSLSGLSHLSKHLPVPGLSSLPLRRSPGHGNGRLEPRQIHNADFVTSPNSTLPRVPTADHTEPTQAAAPQKRATKNFHMGYTLPADEAGVPDEDLEAVPAPKTKRASRGRGGSGRGGGGRGSSGRPTRHAAAAPPQREALSPTEPTPGRQADKGSSESSASSGPAAGFADLVKTVGAAPKAVSPVVNTIPAGPDTPLTTPDTVPTVDAAAVPDTPPPAAKQAVAAEEKEPAPGVNAEAYPVAPGYGPPPPAETKTKTKRHSLVFDTDSLLPPDPETAAKKDPNMGLINMDSNQKPAEPSQPVVPQKAAITPAPTSTDPAPTATQSIYQPSEPGYKASYPTATAFSG